MTENRVPTGVPTGGQFAASTHTEATGVTLDDHSSQQRFKVAQGVFENLREPVKALGDLLDDHMLASSVRKDFPDAITVRVEPYDDDNGPDALMFIKAADGTVIADEIAPFRPSRFDPSDEQPEDGYEFNMQEILDTDLAAEADKARREVQAMSTPDTQGRPMRDDLFSAVLDDKPPIPEAADLAWSTVDRVLAVLRERGIVVDTWS